jgi:2'-5' RNA ligase
VAIELPPEVRAALAETMGELQAAGIDQGVRWVRPEGIHLTLKFLGATDEEDLPAINTALRTAVRDIAPFEVRPEGLGSFGGPRNLRVIWVGVAGDTAGLAGLAEAVDVALSRLRFPRDERAFNAHLTLARVREELPAAERARIHGIVARLEAPAFPGVRVTQVSLMESTLQRGGAVYRALATYALEGKV